MKGLYHSGIPNDVASKEAAKIKTLINELDRRVCMLESDIAREEEHAGASGPLLAHALMLGQRYHHSKTPASRVVERQLPQLCGSLSIKAASRLIFQIASC